MHAAFELQLRVSAVAAHLELDRVETALLARPGMDHLHLPALPLDPAAVHTEKVSSEKGSLLPTLGTLDLHDHVLLVVGILWQQQELQLLVELRDLRFGAPLLSAQKLEHLGVLLLVQHLARGLEVAL